jgi:hypothetical protein
VQLAFSTVLQHTDVPGFGGLPTFLLGASLGGCISLHAALKSVSIYLWAQVSHGAADIGLIWFCQQMHLNVLWQGKHLMTDSHTLCMFAAQTKATDLARCCCLFCADGTQPESFCGLILLAPMISLDKVKQRGLNPILM